LLSAEDVELVGKTAEMGEMLHGSQKVAGGFKDPVLALDVVTGDLIAKWPSHVQFLEVWQVLLDVPHYS